MESKGSYLDWAADQIIALLEGSPYGGNMTAPELLKACKKAFNIPTGEFARAISILEQGKLIRLVDTIRPDKSGATVIRLT